MEIALNVLDDAPEIVPMLEELQLVAFVRSPLAMGLLAGRITRDTRLPQDDIRGILGEDGRSMVEGALGWLWARSPWVIPIPGFRSVAQVAQNARARDLGPLTADQMNRIAAALER